MHRSISLMLFCLLGVMAKGATPQKEAPMVDVTRNDWHVVTVAENGQVSLMRNMPLKDAVKIYEALDPFKLGTHIVSPGEIRTRYLLGPDGWDGCHKGPHHVYDNLEEHVTDGGPEKGRRYRSGSCKLCNFHLFEWISPPNPAPPAYVRGESPAAEEK